MARRWTRHAGSGALRAINSRFLQSTARIWAVRCAGFRNLVCSCARVMEELITATAHVPRARRNGDSSNIHTKLRMGLSLSKRVNCRHPGPALPLLERNRHALDDPSWGLVRSAVAARGSHPRGCRTPGTTKHSQLVLRLRERCTHRISPPTCDGHSPGADLRPLCQRGMEQSPGSKPRYNSRLVHSRFARMGLELHGRGCSDSHGPSVSVRSPQISARTHLDHWCLSVADDPRDGF